MPPRKPRQGKDAGDLGGGELLAVLADGEDEGGEVVLFVVKLEVEALDDELAEHGRELVDAGVAFGVGDGGDVEAVVAYPVGGAEDLFLVDAVGEGDEVFERGGAGGEVAAVDVEALHESGRRSCWA